MGKMKDETCRVPTKSFARLKSKMNTFITDGNHESKKAKSIKIWRLQKCFMQTNSLNIGGTAIVLIFLSTLKIYNRFFCSAKYNRWLFSQQMENKKKKQEPKFIT